MLFSVSRSFSHPPQLRLKEERRLKRHQRRIENGEFDDDKAESSSSKRSEAIQMHSVSSFGGVVVAEFVLLRT